MYLPKSIVFYYIACVLIGVYWTLWVAIPLFIVGLVLHFLMWAGDYSRRDRFPNDKRFKWPSAGAFEVEVFTDKMDKDIASSKWIQADTPYKAVLWPVKEGVEVLVQVEGLTIGKLSYSDATAFRRRLGSKKLTGFKTECKLIRRDHQRESTKRVKEYSLLLDLKPFRTKKKALLVSK